MSSAKAAKPGQQGTDGIGHFRTLGVLALEDLKTGTSIRSYIHAVPFTLGRLLQGLLYRPVILNHHGFLFSLYIKE